MRKLMTLAGAGLFALVGMAGAPAAQAATGGAACQLTGTASFSPGLQGTPPGAPFTYSFTGTLSGCQSSDSTLTGGTISATGSGANNLCEGGTTAGTATVTWGNGQTSTLSFTTASAGALVTVQETVKSGEFSGDSGIGALAFTVADPTQCGPTGTGVSTASFQGVTAVGSPA
jgi:hypothetical protein